MNPVQRPKVIFIWFLSLFCYSLCPSGSKELGHSVQPIIGNSLLNENPNSDTLNVQKGQSEKLSNLLAVNSSENQMNSLLMNSNSSLVDTTKISEELPISTNSSLILQSLINQNSFHECGIYPARWNFDFVRWHLIVTIFLLAVGISKIGILSIELFQKCI